MSSPWNMVLSERVRQNHALEHATVSVLARDNANLRVSAHSNNGGFTIFGEVDEDDVRRAVAEALARLQSGESNLAIHPRCGTNLVVSGTLSALGALAATRGGKRPQQFSAAILASMCALVVAQPLGLLMQKHLTTVADQPGVTVVDVRQRRVMNMVFTEVRTQRN